MEGKREQNASTVERIRHDLLEGIIYATTIYQCIRLLLIPHVARSLGLRRRPSLMKNFSVVVQHYTQQVIRHDDRVHLVLLLS